MGKSNVKANLPLIKDEKIVNEFEEQIKKFINYEKGVSYAKIVEINEVI